MPRRKLGDENADARRSVNMTRSVAVAFNHGDNTGTKHFTSKNTRHSSRKRQFARDIKNISGWPPGPATSTDNTQSKSTEASLFNQLSVNFGALELTGANLSNNASIAAEPNKAIFSNDDVNIQPSALFSREAFSVGSSDNALARSNRRRTVSRANSLTSDLLPSKFSLSGRSSIVTNIKRSSFRSASIVSQSTPVLGKTGRRSIRPFRPLEDGSEIYARYSLGPNSQDSKTADTDDGLHTVESSGGCDQTTDGGGDDDFITQLASQLGEVVLSPCINPVPDDNVEGSPQDTVDTSQVPTLPTAHLKGRAKSFSLGFIPSAFPQEIDIRDLRISF